MSAETAARFEALEGQAAQIMDMFARAGYEPVAPAIIQPAGVFLDCIGEEIRSRTYVFTDPDGQELCLRPDLTIPSCRLYLERNPDAKAEARYAYNGPAFRYQNGDKDATHSREFRQAGIECFGAADRDAADVEVLALILDALRQMGTPPFQLHFGDMGLFRALLAALPIPERWRARLLHAFWRPDHFRGVLSRLAAPAATLPDADTADLARSLKAEDLSGAKGKVASYLEAKGISFIGGRSLEDIASRLLGIAADMREQPLSGDVVKLIEAYLAISGTPDGAIAEITRLTADTRINIGEAIAAFHRRQSLMRAADIDMSQVTFSSDFGRQFEYYSGFVFQVELPGRGLAGQIAGGGRYDGLLASMGAPADVAAIGSAIYTERLLVAREGGA